MNFRFSEAIKHFQNLHTTNKLDMLPLIARKVRTTILSNFGTSDSLSSRWKWIKTSFNINVITLKKSWPQIHPVDTERKLNVHRTFRRRPGRILYALYMLNLRSVSATQKNLQRRLNHQILVMQLNWLKEGLCLTMTRSWYESNSVVYSTNSNFYKRETKKINKLEDFAKLKCFRLHFQNTYQNAKVCMI